MISNSCKWCGLPVGLSDYNDNMNHRLCKAWVIFRIRQKIDSLENYVIWLENLVDELEELD